MVDREARESLRQALTKILTEQTFHSRSLWEVRPSTKDPSVQHIYDELCDYLTEHLPTRTNITPEQDAVINLKPLIERAGLFLQSDLEYVDPHDEGWNWSGVVLIGGIGIAILASIILAALGDHTHPIIATAIKWIGIIGGCGAGLVIFIPYTIIRVMQCVHIFRVRVLRQTVTYPEDPDNYWPFISKEQYEKTLERIQAQAP